MSKAPDRRVQRTHRLLTEALVELILEKGWDAVSVQELCERADVGRATFYTHFADKEDLLVGGLDALGAAIRAQAPISAGWRPLSFARGIIDHAVEQRRMFCAVVGKRGGQIVQNRFRQLLIRLVREDLEHLAPGHPRLDLTVRYVAGAFFESLAFWVESRAALRPDELEAEFHRLTQPVLAALGEPTPRRSDPVG